MKMPYCLSYLMGAKDIQDKELLELGADIMGKSESGSRKLKIPQEHLLKYLKLVKAKLTPGFWNEIVSEDKIAFIFKFKDGNIKEYVLSLDNEAEIAKLCSEFNGDLPDKTANVYKYISENDFYKDFMLEHYSNLISRLNI